jgi:hypothetical protein
MPVDIEAQRRVARAAAAARLASYPLWVANYGVSCPSLPSVWSGWRFWQYAETGRVAGVSGDSDVNVWNGTLDELRAFAGATTPREAVEVYWALRDDGAYELRALTMRDVARVGYHVDGYDLGMARPERPATSRSPIASPSRASRAASRRSASTPPARPSRAASGGSTLPLKPPSTSARWAPACTRSGWSARPPLWPASRCEWMVAC